MKLDFSLLLVVVMALLGGCAVVPPTIVQHPTTVKPEHNAGISSNGSIYQVAGFRPIFEDYRARVVGDVIVMAINENTIAGKTAAASDAKAGSVAYSAPSLLGVPASTTAKTTMATTSANKFSDTGAISSSNNFTGTMGLTVHEVLPNGNLVVSGEKQVALDKSVEYIRFSGVISPDTIIDNTVSSSQVADARVEYRTDSRYDSAELSSELARFFMSMAPF
ncbi:MAG: flagellar basal body L-ring protein FlgH [Burkholderiales bacterium]